MRLNRYIAPGELQVKIVENILINIWFLKLSLWECDSQIIVKKSSAECQVEFEPGIFRF